MASASRAIQNQVRLWLLREVPQQAAEGDAAIENVLDQPVVPSEAEVLLGQLLCSAALHVLAGGEEFLLTAFQDLADALEQGDVRVARPRPTCSRRSR